MKVRSEVVQIRALEREIADRGDAKRRKRFGSGAASRPRRRTGRYVEEPIAGFSFQSAEMCDRSSAFVNNAG